MACFDDLAVRFADRGVDGLADMPAEWWLEIGPIGTMDDAEEHLHTLIDAGAHSIALIPAPDLTIARTQVDHVLALARSIR
jgi:5,10-methylenetetrahydromethanopterin reductase